MARFIVRDVIGFGLLVWFAGYLLGFVFFALVPMEWIGWCVMPFGIAFTCLVLWKWIRLASLTSALLLGIGWSLIAIVCDYVFMVMLISPTDGYYKIDVYLYYLLTLLLPLGAAVLQGRGRQAELV
jgi:hypothetical protein